MIGTKLSHYRVLEALGSGGMGVVYLARDERLERDVAIKVLPAGALADEKERRRFRKEALSLSKINHPNIAMVFELDSQDGVDFLVQELVPGVTMSERIAAEGPMPGDDVARLGVQLADGLAAAHQQSLLHRDIKPANLRVTPEGRLKILDFGLAKWLQVRSDLSATGTLTETGAVVGTLPYMSPEQLRGEDLDCRSDLHAAGASLYEMVCGRRAFPQGSPPAVIAAILGQSPPPPTELGIDVSKDLERVILKCMEKDPQRRYANANQLASDLREVGLAETRDHKTPAGERKRRVRAIGFVAAGIVVLAGALALGLGLGGLKDRLLGGGLGGTRSLAVLPLVNLSRDTNQEYFADGMTDELITRLSQVGALRVISRSSMMQYKGTKKPLRQIANELGIRLIVEGSVVQAGETVRISVQLVDALNDRNLWADSYERSLGDVLALQGDVAREIVGNVQVRLTPEERARLTNARRVNPEALKAYLAGRWNYSRFSGEGLRSAIENFNHSIQIDPTYASAYVGLADTYYMMSGLWLPTSEAMPRARAAATKALELEPSLAAAHASLASVQMVYEWKWEDAERGYRRAIAINPGEVTVHQNYGALLTALGRFSESEREFARARAIDPLSPLVASMSLWPLFEGRQFDRAAAAAQKIVEVDENAFNSRTILGQALLFKKEYPHAIEQILKATQMDPTNSIPIAWLGYAYGVSGQRAKAVEVWNRLQEMQKTSYVQPYCLALICIALGDKEQALGLLERAAQTRSDELFFLKVDPAMDPLRSEPRFQAILKRMGLAA